jgi:hypothetical protein
MEKYIVVIDQDDDLGCCDRCCFEDTNQCLSHHYELMLPDCQDNNCHFELNPEWEETE